MQNLEVECQDITPALNRKLGSSVSFLISSRESWNRYIMRHLWGEILLRYIFSVI
jgi:hypothetical protein